MRYIGLMIVGGFGLLQAASLQRLSLDDMIQKSTAIVGGRVTSKTTVMRGSQVYTKYRLQITNAWKGSIGSESEVYAPGGQYGSTIQTVPGAPRLEEGQDYVLFMWTGRSGMAQIIGFSQGFFELRTDQKGELVLTRKADGNLMVDSSGRVVEDAPVSLRLHEMVDRIHRSLTGVISQ